MVGADDYAKGYPKVAQIAQQVREKDFVIFAGHSPNLLPAMLDARDADGNTHWYDMALFGHTHGGQIAFIGNWLNISKVEDRYEEGWLVENRTNLLISRGVGTSILPIRLFNRPQIHLITVKSTQ